MGKRLYEPLTRGYGSCEQGLEGRDVIAHPGAICVPNSTTEEEHTDELHHLWVWSWTRQLLFDELVHELKVLGIEDEALHLESFVVFLDLSDELLHVL